MSTAQEDNFKLRETDKSSFALNERVRDGRHT